MIPIDRRAPFIQQRWVELYNAGAYEVPAFGVCEIVGGSRPENINAAQAGGRTILNVTRPTEDSPAAVCINGPMPIPSGRPGFGTLDYPAYALYDDTNAPVAGETWGAASGTFELTKDKSGFVILGDAANGIVRIDRAASDCQQFIGFTLTEDMASNKSEEATITSAWGCSCDVGSTATVHDPQAIWRDAIEGCKGIAVLDKCLQAESSDPDEPYYRIIHCQRAAKRAKAALSAAMCGSTPSLNAATWMVYQQGDFVADPGQATIVVNLAGHRGMAGDYVWLERVSNTQPFQWHVVDVEKHALQLLTCATSLGGDPAQLVKCCVTAAVEVCELPPCAEEETSSSAPTSSSPAPDIPENSSVYDCCEWPTTVGTAIAGQFTFRISGITFINNASVNIYYTNAPYYNTLTIGGAAEEAENCLDSCFGRGLYTITAARLVCVKAEYQNIEGYRANLWWAKDAAGTPLDAGLYCEMDYSWYPYTGGRGAKALVPVEVLSCEPLHLRASHIWNNPTQFFYDYNFGLGTPNYSQVTGWAPAECCEVLEFEWELTE